MSWHSPSLFHEQNSDLTHPFLQFVFIIIVLIWSADFIHIDI